MFKERNSLYLVYLRNASNYQEGTSMFDSLKYIIFFHLNSILNFISIQLTKVLYKRGQ